MFDPGDLLGRDFTEVRALWQVPANEAVSILIRASFPRRIRTGEVASDPEFGRELLMLGILGPVVQREGLASLGRQLFEPINDRPVGLIGTLPGQFRDSLVIRTSRLLRSTKVLSATLLLREIRLSPSQ